MRWNDQVRSDPRKLGADLEMIEELEGVLLAKVKTSWFSMALERVIRIVQKRQHRTRAQTNNPHVWPLYLGYADVH